MAFGHTPLLLDSYDLIDHGLNLEQCTGRLGEVRFQYYMATRGA